jgi:hypothetical protein
MYRLATWLSFVGFIVCLGKWGIGDGSFYGFATVACIVAMLGFACLELSGKANR